MTSMVFEPHPLDETRAERQRAVVQLREVRSRTVIVEAAAREMREIMQRNHLTELIRAAVLAELQGGQQQS